MAEKFAVVQECWKLSGFAYSSYGPGFTLSLTQLVSVASLLSGSPKFCAALLDAGTLSQVAGHSHGRRSVVVVSLLTRTSCVQEFCSLMIVRTVRDWLHVGLHDGMTMFAASWPSGKHSLHSP